MYANHPEEPTILGAKLRQPEIKGYCAIGLGKKPEINDRRVLRHCHYGNPRASSRNFGNNSINDNVMEVRMTMAMDGRFRRFWKPEQ